MNPGDIIELVDDEFMLSGPYYDRGSIFLVVDLIGTVKSDWNEGEGIPEMFEFPAMLIMDTSGRLISDIYQNTRAFQKIT